jgi:hypothetical protein
MRHGIADQPATKGIIAMDAPVTKSTKRLDTVRKKQQLNQRSSNDQGYR